MARKQEGVVVVLDVSKSMVGGKSPTRLDTAARALDLFVQQKILFAKKDSVGIVLVGTEETENSLAADGMEGYDHITEMQEIACPDKELQRSIAGIEGGGASGDILAGMIVGLKMLSEFAAENKKATTRLMLITDAGSPVTDVHHVDSVIKYMEDSGTRVDVFGVDFGEGTEKTEVKRENEKLVDSLAQRVGAAVVPVRRAIELLAAPRARAVNQVYKFRGNLEIGGFEIPVHAYTWTEEARLPSLKKQSAVAEEEGHAECGVGMDRIYRSRVDDEEEVPKEEHVKAFRYGKQFVPLTAADLEQAKFKAQRCLRVLGFVDGAAVKRHEVVAGVDAIAPEPGNEWAQRAISALARALQQSRRLAIVRFVKRANTQPLLAYLSPSITAEAETLMCVRLPFAEDIRDFEFPPFLSDPAYQPSNAQLAAAEELITSMDLTNVPGEDGRDAGEAFRPEDTYNPVFQRFFALLRARALDPTCGVEVIEDVGKDTTVVPSAVLKRAQGPAQRFAEKFPTKPAEARAKRRRTWNDVAEDQASASAAAAAAGFDVAAKRQRGAGGDAGAAGGSGTQRGSSINVQALFSGAEAEVNEVGAATPVNDFRALLDRRDADFTVPAITQMTSRIRELVESGDAFFDKALECARALREGALKNAESDRFNAFLHVAKTEFAAGPALAFWDKVKAEGITLISADEAPDSSASAAEADAFHTSAPVPAAAPAPAPAADGDDDLFDDLE